MLKRLEKLIWGFVDPNGRAQSETTEARKAIAKLQAQQLHFMQHEAFDAWLYEVIGGRSLDWLQIRDFIEANSQRLERECAWMNQDKQHDWLTKASAKGAGAETVPTQSQPFAEPKCLCWPTAGTCSICWGENGLSIKGWEHRS